MRKNEKSLYYERMYGACKNRGVELTAEIKKLRLENERLRRELDAKESALKAFCDKIADIERQYSEGILALAEAKQNYESAVRDITSMRKEYLSLFRREIDRIRK